MQKSEYYENHFWFSRPTVLPDQGYTEHKISFLKKYDWVSSKVTTNFGFFLFFYLISSFALLCVAYR